MFNWLIKLLGGVTVEDYNHMVDLCEIKNEWDVAELEAEISELKRKLNQALKGQNRRDPKTGRFVKKK